VGQSASRKLKPSFRLTLNSPFSLALTLVMHGQLCTALKWSRSMAVEPTKLHASPGQWHGPCGHAKRWHS
jgi:hypothetical protein